MRLSHALAPSLALLLLSACSLIIDPVLDDGGNTPGGSFGDRCERDVDCASGRCDERRCTMACSGATECMDPEIAVCASGTCSFNGPPALAGPARVAFIYVGPVGDHGWTLTHDKSREHLLQQVPGVETHFEPSVSPTDAPRVIDRLVASGYNVIVATSFDFLTAMQTASANYQDVNFLLCSGFETSRNLGSYFGRMYQVMWLVGRLAGQVTRNDTIGIVGPVVIPETVRHVNAFTRGVRSVNPNARVLIRWVLAWFDPPNETAATQELIAAGADIVFGHTDTTIPIETADTATVAGPGGASIPVYSIGYDNRDSCRFSANDRCLTSAFWSWGPMVARQVRAMIDGRWNAKTPIWEQMAASPDASAVYLAEIDTDLVPSAVRLDVEGFISELVKPGVEGQMLPFRGPILDNQGRSWVAEGATLTDPDLLRMCWFVEGVYGLDGQPAVVPPECRGHRDPQDRSQ
jgi:basic membrane protein A